MGRDTGKGSGREKMRSDVHTRTLTGPWIMSHANPSAVAWAVGRDWSPGVSGAAWGQGRHHPGMVGAK